MKSDLKPIRVKPDLPKCRVNGCTKKGNFLNGICDKCKVILNKVSKRNKPIRKQSPRSWSKALREAKASFQKLRRLQEMDQNGICLCVNGEYRHWTKAQGGHWIPGKNLSTCFESMNVHPQAGHKNADMDNPIISAEYTAYMIARYGAEEVEKLVQRSKQTKKYSTFELIWMKKEYDNQVLEILKTIK